MAGNQPSQWESPGEKKTKKYVKWGLFAGTGVALTYAIVQYVPTLDAAVRLLGKLFETSTSTMISGGVALATVLLLVDIFSPNGKLHGVIDQLYSSLIRQARSAILENDPITPLLDAQKRAEELKAFYDDHFSRFDGKMSAWRQARDQIVAEGNEAIGLARAAITKIKEQGAQMDRQEASDLKDAAEAKNYEGTELLKTAKTYDDAIARLDKVRVVIVRMQKLANDTIRKMTVDTKNMRMRYNITQDMEGMQRAMKGVLNAQQRDALASEAKDLVDSRFAASIGALENMRDLAMPLLQEQDLNKMASWQTLLDTMDKESQALDAPSVSASVMPMIGATTPVGGGFTDLLRKP